MAHRQGQRRTIRMPDDWWDRVGLLAKRAGLSRSEFICKLIRSRIDVDSLKPLSEPFPQGRRRA